MIRLNEIAKYINWKWPEKWLLKLDYVALDDSIYTDGLETHEGLDKFLYLFQKNSDYFKNL